MFLRAALGKKAFKPVLMRLSDLTSLTDYFLVVSARSPKQVKAVAEAVLDEAARHRIPKYSAEGVSQGNWALLDYGDVIVHVFHTPVREFYDLEGLWADAPRETFPDDLASEIKSVQESAEEGEDFEEYFQ